MNVVASLAIVLAAAQTPPPITPQRTIDWSALPPLPLNQPPRMLPAMSNFVAREIRQRRCPLPQRTRTGWRLNLDLAVLIDEDGTIRTVIPRAINCPTVEQYGVGLVSTFARNNLAPRAAGTSQWYRMTLEFGTPA